MTPLVGKCPATVYLTDSDRTVRTREVPPETSCGSIAGGTTLIGREALAQLGSLRRLDLGGNPAEDAAPLDGLGTPVWLRLPETAEAPAGGLVRLRWRWRDDMGECLACAEPADERRDVAR